jgi:hypothetical protein
MRTLYEEEVIIKQMIHYLETVLEKPHPLFGGLPTCPFSKKARLQNKIFYRVIDLSFSELEPGSNLLSAVQQFYEKRSYDVLLIICPDIQVLSVEQVHLLVEKLNEHIAAMGLIAFGGHPADDFNIQGVYTRQEPFINITVQFLEVLKTAANHLKKTGYYQNWSEENLQQIGFYSRD